MGLDPCRPAAHSESEDVWDNTHGQVALGSTPPGRDTKVGTEG